MLAGATIVACTAAAASWSVTVNGAQADGPVDENDPENADGVALRIAVPPRIAEGDRFVMEVVVTRGPATRGQPLVLTPTAEGDAVEVVRGRFFPHDARPPDAEPLRFEVPCVARTRGTGVVRVEVRTFACPPGDRPGARCRPVTVDAARALRVDRRPPS